MVKSTAVKPGSKANKAAKEAVTTAPVVINRISPWAESGTVISGKTAHVSEAMKTAGLDWSVSRIPLVCNDDGQATTKFALRRSTDSRILGVVGQRFTPLQNVDAFQSFQPFVDAGEAQIDSCGEFDNGSIVWVLAKINRAPMVIAKGDEVEKFILLSHGHTGKMAVRFGFTPIRIICQNTLTLAHKSRQSELIRVRHSEQVVSNISEIRNIMDVANSTFEATAEQYRFLASREINTKDLYKYVRKVLALPEEVVLKKNGSEKGSTSVEAIISRFEGGMGNDLKGVRGTYWAAYNAVTEYLSYAIGAANTAEDRMSSLWTGANARTSNRAFDLALEMAQ